MRTFPTILIAFTTASLIACGTPDPTRHSGAWQPLNNFTNSVDVIPLVTPYFFYAMPIDSTLKSLLERWASDNQLRVVYQHPNNFSLPKATSEIRTQDISTAIEALNKIYAGNNIKIEIKEKTLITQQAFNQ